MSARAPDQYTCEAGECVREARVNVMKRIGISGSLWFRSWLYVLGVCVLGWSAASVAELADLMPSAPDIAATSYVLFEPESDTVLLEYRSEVRLPPASLTKIMTSYVIASELKRGTITTEDAVPISVNAWHKEGSRMFVREGTRVPVTDLLHGIIVQSGNDASVAMAEHIAGSESAFANLMNEYAKLIGLSDSHFSNSTGLPVEDHYTTALDLAKLAKALIFDFPEHYKIYREKEFTYNNIRQQNRNLLLWRDPTVDGVKTGHTDDAGYCLVSSAQRDGMRLIAVVMGADSAQSRARESQKLLKYGFRSFEVVTPYQALDPIHTQRVWMGETEELAMGLADDLTVVVPRGKTDQLEASINIDRYIQAPINRGDVMGSFELSVEGKPVASRDLVALETIVDGGLFRRLYHWVNLRFLEWME